MLGIAVLANKKSVVLARRAGPNPAALAMEWVKSIHNLANACQTQLGLSILEDSQVGQHCVTNEADGFWCVLPTTVIVPFGFRVKLSKLLFVRTGVILLLLLFILYYT